ncbi:MAG: GTPase [Candidatus Shapirobacteria bacterium]
MTKREIVQMEIKRVEKKIRDTPYHKGTEHHIGKLRAKLSKLRDALYEKSSSGGGGGGFAVKKHGDATVGLIGPPSVGKSSLINALCNTTSPVGSYDFTTTRVIPGMLSLNGAKIQFFDLPGLIEKGYLGKGGGRQILAAARAVDLLLLIADKEHLSALLDLEEELKMAGFRLNKAKPKIEIKKTTKGGIKVFGSSGFGRETIKEVVLELEYKNAEITFNEYMSDLSLLIDSLVQTRIYLPAIRVVNKSDLLTEEEKVNLEKKLGAIWISVKNNSGLNELKDAIWRKLNLIRVYLKKKEKAEAEKDPLILPAESKIKDLILAVNSEWAGKINSALIWGQKVKYPGQKVSLLYELSDEDIIYLIK